MKALNTLAGTFNNSMGGIAQVFADAALTQNGLAYQFTDSFHLDSDSQILQNSSTLSSFNMGNSISNYFNQVQNGLQPDYSPYFITANTNETEQYGSNPNARTPEDMDNINDTRPSADVTVSNVQNQSIEQNTQSLQGFSQEALSSVFEASANILPLANNTIVSTINDSNLQKGMAGMGKFGTGIGHDITDKMDYSNAQMGNAIGTTIMAASLASGNPIIGAAGTAIGIGTEMLYPSIMDNDAIINTNDGTQSTPQ